ncbi:type I-E CRISPR-associated protein Cas7/Cse4/CasC [Actinacidiphila sp. DG2A-62]|uniref:type I-E CRISPR-associated protein Cas7/Cse4/CasC n=1 Tax=Actinacidiphila sp. DG2A-62 TaxID=3108821 RepID=UPI002DBCF7C6|nr:type I-E CRISPR-associated protein Cas7/Cse4/CasC [Actinacidiphila sp. DG2A-62]MEC3996150.1 type I-E CRISPR-associated protein Cas7/Cse4/CasC [Actinacidiphila sp. DG2A-62]
MTKTSIPGVHIDVHIIQTLPLSGLNLDADGNPKSVVIGGVQRARLSPQAQKRAARLHLENVLPEEAAVRTRRLIHTVSDLLIAQKWPKAVAEHAAVDVFVAASAGTMALGSTSDSEDEESNSKDPLATAALIYTPATTAGKLAAVAATHRDAYEAAVAAGKSLPKPKAKGGKSKGKAAKPEDATIADPKELAGLLASANGSIALLGRTLMEIGGAERDSSVQVASAFTTHEAVVEVDFFVAVDDYAAASEGVPDVGQMGDSQQTAGTFYRYTTINLPSLLQDIDNDTDLARRLCEAFIDGFIHTLPATGQTNSAAWTLPDLVHITVRSDRPVNLSTAFDKPIRTQYDGHVGPSIAALATYAHSIEKITANRGVVHAVHAHTATDELRGLGKRIDNYTDLVRKALDAAFGTTA